jgi:hypothetical protein
MVYDLKTERWTNFCNGKVGKKDMDMPPVDCPQCLEMFAKALQEQRAAKARALQREDKKSTMAKR